MRSKSYDIQCSNVWRPWLLPLSPLSALLLCSVNSSFAVMNRDKSEQENSCVSFSFYILQLGWPHSSYVTNLHCSVKMQPINCRFIYNKHDTQTKCTCVFSCFSCVWLFATLWTVAHQAPLSIRFSRWGYWHGLPCPLHTNQVYHAKNAPRSVSRMGCITLCWIFIHFMASEFHQLLAEF